MAPSSSPPPPRRSPKAGSATLAAQDHVARLAPDANVGFAEEDHHEWCLKIWKRMDRDENHTITAHELDCEEFRGVLRAILAPQTGASVGGAMYHRMEMNMKQAIHFCMRKADFNTDATLSFPEFKSFMMYLRQNQLKKKNHAEMVFALFDLDGDDTIGEEEFREIFRFFLGRKPLEKEFQNEWASLDVRGNQKVTRVDYARWLKTSTNPIFKQQLMNLEAGGLTESPSLTKGRSAYSTPILPDIPGSPNPGRSQQFSNGPESPGAKWNKRLPAPGMIVAPEYGSTQRGVRPGWNQRFNAGVNPNLKCPQGQRCYFSRPQSLSELKRFYQTHTGFDRHLDKMHSPRLEAGSSRDSEKGAFVF